MGRYSDTKLRKDKQGRTHRVTTIYKDIPETNEDIWVITTYGDRLDLLAYEYYGSQYLWWAIAKANGLTVLKVPDGTSLRIPPKSVLGI
jgi:nucleoid-associated protein YgaU